MKSIPWEEIQKNLNAPKEEYSKALIEWLQADEENSQIWQEIKHLNAISWSFPDYFKPNKLKAWEKISTKTLKKKNTKVLQRYILHIAASVVFLISATLSTIYIKDQFGNKMYYSEVFSPYGHKTMVILPDSSKVWLNGNSRLKYNPDFLKHREVEIYGEALFKVKKWEGKNFSVNSNNLNAEVYGTTFNYKDYEGDKEAEIALLEGSLGVLKNKRLVHKMKPGEVVIFESETNRFEVTEGNMAIITSWCSNELIIDNQPFSKVVKYIERWYGVDITIADNLHIEQKLSFKVKTESLHELLFAISKICPIKYEINGKDVMISTKN